MSESIRVVVRYADGALLKGTTHDFLPNRATFHLAPAEGGPLVEVRCDELKAVFVVKDFRGDPGRSAIRGFLDAPATTAQGRKIAVRFKDGELLCGHTLSYQPDRTGFFLVPADADGNNIRVYVVTAAAAEVKAGPAADALAAKALAATKK
jgi:hypothetical protein